MGNTGLELEGPFWLPHSKILKETQVLASRSKLLRVLTETAGNRHYEDSPLLSGS